MPASSRGLANWSRYANSQSKDKRGRAALEAKILVDELRRSGDWRTLIGEVCIIVAQGAASKLFPAQLFAEALTRELETCSIENIVMKNLVGG